MSGFTQGRLPLPALLTAIALVAALLVAGCSPTSGKNSSSEGPSSEGSGAACRPNEYSKIPALKPQAPAEKRCATDKDCVLTDLMNGSCCSVGCGPGVPVTRAFLSRLRKHHERCCAGAKFTCKQYRCPESKLSFWHCSDTPEDREEIVLAFAAGFERKERMDLALILLFDLLEAEQTTEDSMGDTPVEDLRDLHTDLVQLTAEKLVAAANIIAPRIRDDTYCRCYSPATVVQIVARAVKNKRLSIEDLKDKMRDATATELAKQA
ncbi:MAG: hypothetical protein ABI333_23475 [bacterium]